MQILKKTVTIIAIILTILTSSITIAVTKTKGTVTTDTLRLRQEASLESTVLELLYKDNEVEIIAEEGDWYKVKFKDYTGYVSKEYVRKNNDTENSNNNVAVNNTVSGENNNQNANNNTTNTTVEQNNQNANENNTTNSELVNKQATTNSDLNVYILPLINSNTIGSLKQNTKVDIVNITGVWAYIKTDDIAGWIRVDKISVNDSSTLQNNTTNSQDDSNKQNDTNQSSESQNTNTDGNKEYTPKTYYIKSSAVNVRSKSSTASDVVTTLVQNTEVKVVGEESDWYKVETNGKTGYILKTLLSEKKVEVTSRSSIQERKTTQESENNSKEQEATNYNASKGEQIVAYAKKYLGCKYVYAGSGPSTFDCSGFTMYVYKHFGYSMGHSAVTQSRLGKYVSRSNLQPGDLVIFNNRANSSIGHVGIYVGGGNFIHASSGGGRVMISSLSGSYYNTRYVTGRRII